MLVLLGISRSIKGSFGTSESQPLGVRISGASPDKGAVQGAKEVTRAGHRHYEVQEPPWWSTGARKPLPDD